MRKILAVIITCFILWVNLAMAADKPSFKYTTLIDKSLNEEKTDYNLAATWMGYALSHVNWINDHYKDKDLAKEYKLTFEEEFFCRDKMVKIWSELKQNKPGLKNAYMDDMLKVRKAGFLDEYVWAYYHQEGWAMPEGLKLEAFNAWRTKNLSKHQPKTLAGIQIDSE